MNKMTNESVERQINQWKKKGSLVSWVETLQNCPNNNKQVKEIIKIDFVKKWTKQEHNLSVQYNFKLINHLFIWVNNSLNVILCVF